MYKPPYPRTFIKEDPFTGNQEIIVPTESLDYVETFFTDIQFFDSENNLVAPSSGNIDCLVESEGGTKRLAENGSFEAAEVYSEALKLPHTYGPNLFSIIKLDSVTAPTAQTVKVYVRKR